MYFAFDSKIFDIVTNTHTYVYLYVYLYLYANYSLSFFDLLKQFNIG